MTYRCPDHITVMTTFPENAAPPMITVLADGLLAVGWGAPARCAACDGIARTEDLSASPLHAPEIHQGMVDRPTIARGRVAYDYGRPAYYIPTMRLFADEATSVVPSKTGVRS